jgi:copper resistance protein B
VNLRMRAFMVALAMQALAHYALAAPSQDEAHARPPTGQGTAVQRAYHDGHGHAEDHGQRNRTGMDHRAMSQGPADRDAIDHAADDATGDPHAAHHAPPAPRTPIPRVTEADRAAAVPPAGGHAAHDDGIFSYVRFDRLETWNADSGAGVEWAAQAWIGTDLDRLWLRSEGERVHGATQRADFEALYGHAVSPWWTALVGVRHDVSHGNTQELAAVGLSGMAPYRFDVAVTAYAGVAGQVGARVEVANEVLLTNRLILQPLFEVNAWAHDDRARGIGSGLSTMEAGLRLRYEITRRFAPYIGIMCERAFGVTARFRRAGGEDGDDVRLVAGLRVWF